MHPGARHLADGEEARHRGASVEVGGDAAHPIVRRRGDRYGFARPVDAVATQLGVDGGKALGEEVGAERSRVETDGPPALRGHRVGDAAGHDVTRRELGIRMHVDHEPVSGVVDEHCTLAAHGLGDEEVHLSRERRGVELVELEVGDGRARPHRRGETVAGGEGRVGGVREQLPGAAGGEDDGVGGEHGPAAIGVPYPGTGDPRRATVGRSGIRQLQVDEEGVLENADAALANPRDERRRDRGPGGVTTGAEHSRVRVCGLEGEREGLPVTVELDARGDQVGDSIGAFGAQHAHSVRVGEPRPGDEGVGNVGDDRVRSRGDRGHPTLGPPGVAIAERPLRDQRDVVRARRTQCCCEARDAGPHHDHGALCRGAHDQTRTAGRAASIRSRARRAGSTSAPATVIRLTTSPATSRSSTQAR